MKAGDTITPLLLTEANLLPGDILLYVGNVFKSKIALFIQKSENDIENHAAIYTGKTKAVFESLLHGPQFNTIENSIKEAKNVYVLRTYPEIPLPTEAQILKVIEDEKFDDMRYGFFDILAQKIYIQTGVYLGSTKNKHGIICSVLVTKIRNILNNLLFPKYWLWNPSMISKYAKLRVVGFLK